MTNTVEDAEDANIESIDEHPSENEIDGAMAETIISAPSDMTVRKSRRLLKLSPIEAVDDRLKISPTRPAVTRTHGHEADTAVEDSESCSNRPVDETDVAISEYRRL